MASVDRRSIRSPTPSQSDSIRDGPLSRTNGQPYQRRSSVIDENDRDDNDYEEPLNEGGSGPRSDRPPQRSEDQYIAALRHRFPSRPKGDYSYTKPPGPANPPIISGPATNQPTTTIPSATTTTPASGPYQTTARTNIVNQNTPNASDDRTFQKPALRRVDPNDQNTYARRVANDTSITASQPKQPITPGLNVRINDPNTDPNLSNLPPFNRSMGIPRTQESTFESVPLHGGPVSYLGTGTFSQFEHCLRACLERERIQTGMVSQITRQDFPSHISTHDYGYYPTSTSPPPHLFDSSSSHFMDYPSRPASMFGLDDIRHINVALSRSGVSLFPYERPFHQSYPSPISFASTTMPSSYPSGRRIIGEVVSACRIVDEDPATMFHGNGSHAVQNVWNALRNHQPFSHIDQSRSMISPRGPYDF